MGFRSADPCSTGVAGCIFCVAFFFTVALFTSLWPSSFVLAAETLNPVVVTGTRTERLLLDSPVRTEVVSREQMERYHARDLKEALQYLPGVQLREIHGKSGYEVWMQGMNADRVLILIDGLPVSPTTGSSVDVTQLSLLDVERVEVVKGATSAQYGSAAMGGVVNLITRPIDQGAAAQVWLDTGTYGEQNPSGDETRPSTHHGRAQGSMGGEQWRARVAADENAGDGIDPDPDTWPQPGNEFKRRTLDMRLEWHATDDTGRGYVQGGRFEEDTSSRFLDDVNANNQLERHSKEEALQRDRLSAGYRGSLQNGMHWQVDGVVEQQSDDTLKHNESFAAHYDDRQSDYQVERYNTRLELPEWNDHEIMIGLDYSRETLSQFKDGNPELQHPGGNAEVRRDGPELFLQDDWFIGDRWELLLGARFQEDSDFGSHFSPKLNLRYQWIESDSQNVFVRAGWGTGYRVPNLKERYYVFDHSQLGYMVLGNPDLQPESSSSWQIGMGALFNDNLTLDLNVFYNDLTDLIQTDFDHYDGTVAIYHYLNVSSAMTRGFEITSQWHAKDHLTLNGGYTFLDSENDETGANLVRRPRHQLTAGVDWQVWEPGLSVTALARGQSEETVNSTGTLVSPGWVVMDIKLNFDLSPNWRLFGGIDNVFNRQRDFQKAGIDFGPLAGRYFYMGAQWQWEFAARP